MIGTGVAMAFLTLSGLALWTMYIGKVPSFPDGRREVGYRGMIKLHVVIHDDVIWKTEDVTKAMTLAVWSAVSQWIWMVHDRKWKEIELDMRAASEVCVHITTDGEFDRRNEYNDIYNRQAFLTNTGSEFGTGLPMIVIRASVVQRSIKTGEPIISEMLRMLSKASPLSMSTDDQSDGRIWLASGGVDSIQFHARKLYSDTVF